MTGGFEPFFALPHVGLEGVALGGFGAHHLLKREAFLFDSGYRLGMNFQFGEFAFVTGFQFLGLGFARREAVANRPDLLGLELKAAAGAFGLEIELGDFLAGLGELGFGAVAGFAGGGVFALFFLHILGDALETGLRLVKVEGELGGFALQHAESAGDGLAQMGHHFGAQLFVTLGFRGLTLQRIDLAADFFEDVEHSGEVLLGAFELRFGQALAGFVLADAGRFFDNGAAVGGLIGKNLANAALLDDGVTFGAKAGAGEEVLNVAETGGAAVDQVLAFAGAVEAAGNDDIAMVLYMSVGMAVGVPICVAIGVTVGVRHRLDGLGRIRGPTW